MESQIKPSDAHSAGFSTEKKPPGNDRNWTNNGASASPRRSSLFVVDLILRLLAIGATLSAAIVMGTNKQTVIGAIGLRPDGVPILGPLSAKYHYSPAFTFFVVANAVACVYTVFSLILSVTGKPAVLAVSDMVMVALVSAGASAAAAIAYVGYKGNSHTGWVKICGAFDRFCRHTAGAVVISFVGVIFFMILTVMSIYSVYRRTSSGR